MTGTYSLLNYVHVLLFVFWLGTDLGVLIAARRIRNPELSAAQRLTLLELALVIDVLPRIAFTQMPAVGITLANMNGLISLPSAGLALIWVLCALWLCLTLSLLITAGRPVQARLAILQRYWLVLVAIASLLTAVAGLFLPALSMPPWLALKFGLFGLVALAAIGIDHAFFPLVPAMAELAESGSSTDVEARISIAIDRALRYVYALYACLIVAGLLGAVKTTLF